MKKRKLVGGWSLFFGGLGVVFVVIGLVLDKILLAGWGMAFLVLMLFALGNGRWFDSLDPFSKMLMGFAILVVGLVLVAWAVPFLNNWEHAVSIAFFFWALLTIFGGFVFLLGVTLMGFSYMALRKG